MTERTCGTQIAACRPVADTSKETALLRKPAAIAMRKTAFAPRKRAKLLVATVLRHLGVFRLERLILSRSSRFILAFHRVLPDDEINRLLDPQMYLTVPVFRELLIFLRSHYDIVHLRELLTWDQPTSGRQKPVCAITFDDGYLDNYTSAFPVLKEMQVPATIFLTAGLIGIEKLLWYDTISIALARMADDPQARKHLLRVFSAHGLSMATGLDSQAPRGSFSARRVVGLLKTWPCARLDRLLSDLHSCVAWDGPGAESFRLLNWNQIRQMMAQGIQVGDHTLSHCILPVENEQTAQLEIRQSKCLIESSIGTTIDAFAYPNGACDDRVVWATRRAGFQIGLTLKREYVTRNSDPMRLGRFIINQQDIVSPTGRFSSFLFEYEKSVIVLSAKRLLRSILRCGTSKRSQNQDLVHG
jgi:peptidoglycan/xylan/chitin deacetylase (PgdA/CDA1 family)